MTYHPPDEPANNAGLAFWLGAAITPMLLLAVDAEDPVVGFGAWLLVAGLALAAVTLPRPRGAATVWATPETKDLIERAEASGRLLAHADIRILVAADLRQDAAEIEADRLLANLKPVVTRLLSSRAEEVDRWPVSR